MNFRLLVVFFLFFSSLASSQELNVKGVFTGSNVYIMNPFAQTEDAFTIESISINGKPYSEAIQSSAFEVDLTHMGFKLGEDLRFSIKYKDSIVPSIINMEAIQAVSSFEMKKAFIDKDQFLNWGCTNEIGSLTFFVQQYRWNKWLTVGQLRGVGTDGLNYYRIKVPVHSGQNMFRVYQIDQSEKVRYSDTIQFHSKIKPVYLVNKKVTSRLNFSAPTQFEIFDTFGNLIFDGFGKEVRFDDLIPGKYYVNYDNTIGDFIKE
ncbi:hypothetical protein EV201_2833 [Ancylomarina subtilis]|uniref:Secreted protein (Por secretion system target) n=1 Tax=Ancylomarina subtilis TaxID=1639035 RepID=A0A4Q7VC13_9BACT|nr:hypothetical protein [Ancylomarina subtilis]RZT92362.1 hypothetical protein EV201_2833 [Ancylomarina subtilis]